jgi:hypothetical protein
VNGHLRGISIIHDIGDTIKGYRLLRESDHTIFYSRDVNFDDAAVIEKLPRFKNATNVQEIEDLFEGIGSVAENDADNELEEFADEVDDEPEQFLDDDSEYFSDEGGINDSEYEPPSDTDSDESAYAAVEKEWIDNQNSSLDNESLFALLASDSDTPTSFKQAMSGPDADKWMEAMHEEIASMNENNDWTVEAQKNVTQKAVGSRWVFSKKYDEHGNILGYKARFVAKGFSQRYGVDYEETYSPVVKFKSVRTFCAIAASKGMKIFQNDVKTAFLNSDLHETVFVDQPEGFEQGNGKLKLNKALYGLKQASREWNAVLHKYLIYEAFIQSKADPCIYMKWVNGELIMVGVYVDDVLTGGKDIAFVQGIQEKMKKKFRMSEGGLLFWYLNVFFKQKDGEISMSQAQYFKDKLDLYAKLLPQTISSTPIDHKFQELLERAEQSKEFEPNFPYRSMVGSLMYGMLGTRPD